MRHKIVTIIIAAMIILTCGQVTGLNTVPWQSLGALGGLRPLSRMEKQAVNITPGRFRQVFSPLDLDDFEFIDSPYPGLEIVLYFRYKGQDKTLQNGYRLKNGKAYAIKFGKTKILREACIEYTLDFLARINPYNTAPNLPILAGYVEIGQNSLGYLGIGVQGVGIVTEFIEGRSLYSYLDLMMDDLIDTSRGSLSDYLEIQRKILGSVLSVFEAHKTTFAENGLIYGDLHLNQIMVRQDDGRIIFLDLDTPTPATYKLSEPNLDEIVKIRRTTGNLEYCSDDRAARIGRYSLDQNLQIAIDKSCQLRDDLYSLCYTLSPILYPVMERLDESKVGIIRRLFNILVKYSNIASSEANYAKEEEKKGGALHNLIREIKTLLEETDVAIAQNAMQEGNPFPAALAPPTPYETLHGSILRPLAEGERRPL